MAGQQSWHKPVIMAVADQERFQELVMVAETANGGSSRLGEMEGADNGEGMAEMGGATAGQVSW